MKIQNGSYYVENIDSKVGTGDTAKAAKMQNYWRAEVLPGGQVIMELLDMNEQPSGYKEIVEPADFAIRFQAVPEFRPKELNLKKERADKITARAERHLEKKEYLSAEFEFGNALRLDDDNVRANYGLGKTYAEQGDTEKAKGVFKKLVTMDDVLDPQYKHIFNEMGIEMRKLGMFQEAVKHYHNALKLENGDENLWFNLGRALFEAGQKAPACKAFKAALDLNPDFQEAKNFLAMVNR